MYVSPCIGPVHVHRRWFAVSRISFTNWRFTVHGRWNEMIKAKCRTPLEPTRQSGDNFLQMTTPSTALDDKCLSLMTGNFDGIVQIFMAAHFHKFAVLRLCEFWQTTPPTMRQIPPYYIQCILRNRQIAPFPGSRNDDHCSRKPKKFVTKKTSIQETFQKNPRKNFRLF